MVFFFFFSKRVIGAFNGGPFVLDASEQIRL